MNIGGIEFLIGADPEVFLRDELTKSYIPAGNLVKGTKDKPFPVSGGFIQKDGLAAEFNILPAKAENEFIYSIQSVMHQLEESINKDHIQLAIKSSVKFTKKALEGISKEDLILGCMPDYNAYTRTVNPIPVKKHLNMAVAGGHIHIGWTKDQNPEDEDHLSACIELTKQLDATLGLKSLLEDKDTKRRTLYGELGSFRPKSYGVEYRVLSNYWIANSIHIRSIFRGVCKSIDFLFQNEGRATNYRLNGKTIPEIFNDNDPYEVRQAILGVSGERGIHGI